MTYAQPTGGVPQTASKATTALIVAIVGFVVCGPIGGAIALVLADQAAKEIRASNGRLAGEGAVAWQADRQRASRD